MIAKLDKLNKSLVSIEYWVTVPLFLVMVTLMFTQVIFRYFLESPLPWSEEVIRYLFVAVTYLGGAIATMEREHIEINFIQVIVDTQKDPDKRRKIVNILNVIRDTLALAFLSLISYLTYFLVYDQFRYDMVSSAAQIPMWIVTSFMLAGLVLSALHCLTNIILNLNGYHRTGYDDEPEDEGGDVTCLQ